MGITINSSANLTAWEDTSSSSQAMPTSTATKTFVVSAGKNFLASDTCQATATAAVIPTGIIGTVSSYSGTSLVIAPNNSLATNATICGVYGLIWSKTTITTGTGAKTFNVSFNPYKVTAANLTVGLAIRVHHRTAPFTNFMVGTITSYTASTGALVVNVTSATGSASVADWVICQDGTFTAWDISPQWGDTFTINGSAVLSITQTPKLNLPKFVNCLTNGRLEITNNSTSTMLLGYTNEPNGPNNPSNTAWRFEQNATFYVKGDFIVLGTAAGTANETFAVPAGIDYPSYVEVETGVGTNVYEPWFVGPLAYDERGQICMIVRKTDITPNSNEASKWLFWNPSTRNLESGDGSTGGITLTAGVRIRIPNIHLSTDVVSPNVVLAGTGAQDSAVTGSVATGTGSKSFTIATGFTYANLDNVLLEYPGAPGVYLTGTVTAYNNLTGAMTFNATGSQGTYTGTGWVLRDQRGALTVGDWSANSGVTTTNGRLLTNGEIISAATRTNGGFTGITRNLLKEWSLPSTISSAGGTLLWFTGDASGSGGSAGRRWQIDTAPSGTVYLENCSTHLLSLDLLDYSAFTALRVGAEHVYLRSTLGSTTINRFHCASVATVKQYHGLRATSLIGATSVQNVLTWTDAPDPAGNATSCLTFSNVANLTAWNNIRAYNTSRQRGFQVLILDTVTLAAGVTPTNTYLVGSMSVTGLSGQEWEGIYLANKTNGNVGETGEAGIQHISLNRCANMVFRKLRGMGTAKLVNNQIFAGDAFSYNIIIHDLDFSANNTASVVTGLLSNSGTSNVTIANCVMGTTAAAFTNSLNRGGSGLVEKNLTFRRILSPNSSLGNFGDNNGITYSNGLRVEMVTAVMSYMRTAPTSNLPCPSYKDCSNFYTLIDQDATTGRLCIGAFAGESSVDLYDLTGTSYINNAGLAYFEGNGDSGVAKAQYALRGFTSFKNIDPVIMDSRNTYTTSTSSVTIGTGAQTFIVGASLAFATGDPVTIVNTTDTRNALSGTVTSYASTTLQVNITKTTGSGTLASWQVKGTYPSSVATYEFRYCQWGQDITAASWQALNGTNLAAVTIADSNVGINMQVRWTGVGVLAGRYLQQIVLFTNNDAAFAPPVSTTPISLTGAAVGAAAALISLPSTILGSGTTDGSGNITFDAPYYADGVTRSAITRARLYGYVQAMSSLTYYSAAVSLPSSMALDPGITLSSGAAAAITGVSVVDHGGSPVSWNSKSWGITVTGNRTTNPALTYDQIIHYIHYSISQTGSFSGKSTGLLWHNMLPPGTTATARGDYGSGGFKGVRVVDENGNPFPGCTSMQADDGSFYTPPVQYTLTVAGTSTLVGAEIRIYDLDNVPAGSYGTELAGIESNPSSTFSWSYSSATVPNTILIQVLQSGFVEVAQTYVTTANNATVTVTMVSDTNA
jgi:hypothetical protein